MPCMSTPTVIETQIDLEPVTADTFVADLDRIATDRAGVAAFILHASSARGRRIYD